MSPLPAEQVPAEAETLAQAVAARLPRIELPALLIEIAHLTPAQHDHINVYGTYSFDVETELRRNGHRPLRSPAA